MGVKLICTAGEDGAFKASPGGNRNIHRAVAADKNEFLDGWKRGTVRDGDRHLSVTVKAKSHGRTVDLSWDQWKTFVPSDAKDD